ncbi:hypothetical protein B0T24DRAFT_594962 [Lasiosphaeria ovina]|uniref:CFEM domain-containing protein n=1 Tax=Lasiosphaeria ovina TaxID=92902 RepID=A0AAE0K7S1_9PEZI|nr:hypothetical protein B0T24DRAFT_594962 [Lasiosphaeria ovina]
MLPTTLLMAAFAALASARPQVTTDIPSQITAPPALPCSVASAMPSCGIPCITSAAIGIGCTAALDFGCQCQHAAAMQAAVMPCVASACGTLAPVVGSVANAICTACLPAMAMPTPA